MQKGNVGDSGREAGDSPWARLLFLLGIVRMGSPVPRPVRRLHIRRIRSRGPTGIGLLESPPFATFVDNSSMVSAGDDSLDNVWTARRRGAGKVQDGGRPERPRHTRRAARAADERTRRASRAGERADHSAPHDAGPTPPVSRRKPDLPARSRGVIALVEENCTACMLCARECPDWCIYIDSHKETRAGARGRTAARAQRARPVRDRLLVVHVLRHLRRGVPVRRALLVPGVRLRRVRHPRPPAREGPAGEWVATVPDLPPSAGRAASGPAAAGAGSPAEAGLRRTGSRRPPRRRPRPSPARYGPPPRRRTSGPATAMPYPARPGVHGPRQRAPRASC